MAKVIHYFIPHEKNDHKPYFTRHPGLASILIFALAVQTTINVFFSTRPQILGFATNIYKNEVISLTNSERSKAQLPQLVNNAKLDEAARLKALHMFEHDYWAHVSPTGVDPWYWFEVVGYEYTAAGENLARDFDTSNGVVSAWMASPSHRDNILYENFTEIGLAVVDGNIDGEDTTLVVQLFATPTPQAELQVEPIVQPTHTPIPPTITPYPTPIPTTLVITPPTIQSPTNTPTPTITATATLTPTSTPSPSPLIAFRDNAQTSFQTVSGFTTTPPEPIQTNLSVITNLRNFSFNRIFSLVLILALIALLTSESVVLWYKGIKHPHAHRIVHVGILILILAGTLYGAGGLIL